MEPHSSTSSFERPIPDVPWLRLGLIATGIVAVATLAWEFHVRSLGYAATYDDSGDFWAQRRGTVKPDSLVIIGDSRP